VALEYQRVGNEERMRYRICKPEGVLWHLYNDKGFIDVYRYWDDAVLAMNMRYFPEILIEEIRNRYGF